MATAPEQGMKRLFETGKLLVRMDENGIEVTVCAVAGKLIMVTVALHQNVAQAAHHERRRA